MIKYYCDACGSEMADVDTMPEFQLEAVKVRIQRSVEGNWNGGQVCVPCIRRVVANGQRVQPDEVPF